LADDLHISKIRGFASADLMTKTHKNRAPAEQLELIHLPFFPNETD
jgi:hypothetical protein